MTVVLRCCAACSGSFAGHLTRPGEPYWCPPCHARRMEGFDPREGDGVHHVDRQCGPWSDLVVVARSGDQVTVQVLGSPDRRWVEPLGSLVPGNGYGRHP